MTATDASIQPALGIRPLSGGEVEQVEGGILAALWFGYCIAVGVAAGYAIAAEGGNGGSAPGDYPTVPKDTA
jgi:hypothetical protein